MKVGCDWCGEELKPQKTGGRKSKHETQYTIFYSVCVECSNRGRQEREYFTAENIY